MTEEQTFNRAKWLAQVMEMQYWHEIMDEYKHSLATEMLESGLNAYDERESLSKRFQGFSHFVEYLNGVADDRLLIAEKNNLETNET